MSRKALTVAVVAATIAWSIGLSALVLPLTVKAAASGSLVKASLPAVYYVGADGKRYVFPNEKTYKTWYSDFSTVQTITDAELAAMPIGGNVTYRPGVRMVKIQTDPKVYAVAKGGTLRWVTSESVATSLYGSDWNTKIDDVPDAFFTNYSVGTDITSSSQYSVSGEMAGSTTINQDKNLGTSVSGTLTASLASDGPTGASLPGGATGVNMLKFNVKNNGSTAASLDSLTIHRTGAGAPGDFANVYIYMGAQRLTTGRTINTSTNDASFSSLGVSVAPGATVSLWVAADLIAAPGAGNVHSLQVTDLKTGSTMAAGLPLTGPSFTMTSAAGGSVTITRSGANPLPNVKAGGMNQKIAEFQLAAGAAEDIMFNRITLFNGGAVNRGDVTNLVLKQGGQSLGTASGYDSNDRAAITLLQPVLLEKGATKTFEVYADIAAGARSGATETLLTYLDDPSDLYAVGQTFGYGVRVDDGTNAPAAGTFNGAGCALGAGNCSSTRVEAGQLTITFNGPAAKDVATNGKDVELYNFTLAAQSNLEIRNLRMNIQSVGGADDADRGDLVDDTGDAAKDADDVANFTDIKVVDTATGATVAGPLDLTVGAAYNDQTQALLFTETWNLAAGTSKTLKVTADIRNNTNADFIGDDVRVDLNAFQANDIRNLDDSTFLALTDIVPNGGINGNQHNVQAPTLTIGVASTPVQQTYIQGTQGSTLAGWTLKAGDASDIRVTTIVVTGFHDEAGDGTAGGDFQGCEGVGCPNNTVGEIVLSGKLWNGSTQLGDTESPSASTAQGAGGVLTFDNLNLTVPKGQTLTLTLTGNLASGLGNLPDGVRFQILANGDVSATDPDGNSLVAGANLTGAPASGPEMVIQAAGTLTIALAADDAESEAGLVVGGTSNAVLAKYKFTAQNEELKLTKARFNIATANTASSLSLYDGSTLVAGPVSVNGAGQADFSGVNFVIPKDGNKTLTVKGNMNSVGTGGSTTGSLATVTLEGNDAGTFEVRGTSAGSNTLITEADAAVVDTPAREKVMRRTKPTISLVALPSTTLTAGDITVLRFTVSADAADAVAVKGLVAEIQNSTAASTLTATAQSSIRRVGDAANLNGAATLQDADAGCTTGEACLLVVVFTNEEVIAAGTSRTYDVRVNADVAATNDAITAKLRGDTTLASGLLTASATPLVTSVAVGGTDSNFVWSDNSAVPHSDVVAGPSSADWANGTHVKVLPTDTQSMTK